MARLSRKPNLSRRTFLAISIAASLPLAAEDRAAAGKRREALQHGPLTPFIGPASAVRKLAVYMDYHCPYCRAMDPLLPQLSRRNPGLQIEYKEFPVLRWDSEAAARIALVSQKHGRFSEVHERLMHEQGDFTGLLATRIAESLGMDSNAFRHEMGSAAVSAELAKNMHDADELGIEATPGLVTARAVMQGALSLEQLQALANAA